MPAARLALQHLPGETRAFLYRDGRLHDLAIERDGEAAGLGDRFLGRVTRLDRRLSAAFVALGEGPDGLLPLNAAPKGLSEGDRLVVQITRTASEDKGPRLKALEESPPAAGQPRRLEVGLGTLGTLLAAADGGSVETDHPALQRRLQAAGHAVRLLPQGFPPADSGAFDAEIEALLRPAVALPGGGSLLVESGRTLTAVDVNLGARQGAGVALETNRAAAAELVRQLRLRALGGRVVVDFLESAGAAVRRETESALKAGFAADPERVKFLGWSRGGLYELTRRRSRPSLAETLLEPVPDGLGLRRRPLAAAFEALRAVAQAARAAPGRPLALGLSPALYDLLPKLPAFPDLEARLGRSVALRQRPDLGPGADVPFVIETGKD